ncbi:MAG: aryl-sulfate sulfotransferase [Myxococcales bacterium]|nr:aryl-sulfate sulfotransferase [Myxococcales bacterium]
MRAVASLALVSLAACGGAAEQDVQATVSDTMGTVVRVAWTTKKETTGHVAFGADGALDRTTVTTAAGTEHEVWLVGLPPEADVAYQVVVDGEAGEERTVTTEALPGDVPTLTAQGSGQDHFMAVPLLDIQAGIRQPAIIDPQGRIVWLYTDPYDLEVFRVHVALDGSGIVYSSVLAGGDAAEGSKIVRLDWEGNELATHDVDYLVHDFVELDDGTIVSLAALFQDDGEGNELEGNKLVSVAPDGTATDIWNTWDCFDPKTHPNLNDARPDEWTHANAMDYDAERDAFVLGFLNCNMVAHVDRQTGECDWSLGGPGGSVTIDGSRFRRQHQFHWTGDSFLVFDNQGAGEDNSRVIEYDFDPDAQTATMVNSFLGPRSPILGDVYRFDDGDTQVVWSVARQVQRLDSNGDEVWRLDADGRDFGFAELLPDPGNL